MEKYEAVFILDPNLDSKAEKEEGIKIEKLITSFKGKVLKKNPWGKRELAYPIKKFNEGIYLLYIFSLEPKNLPEWGKKIKLNEKIIRHLLIRVEEQPTKS